MNTRLPCGMGGANLLVGGQAEHRQTAGRKPEAVGGKIPLPESQLCAFQGDGDPFVVVDFRLLAMLQLVTPVAMLQLVTPVAIGTSKTP